MHTRRQLLRPIGDTGAVTYPITDLPIVAGDAALDALPTLERALAGGAPVRPYAADAIP